MTTYNNIKENSMNSINHTQVKINSEIKAGTFKELSNRS